MSDQPLTLATLARFHQEVLMPEVRQVVREEVVGLRDEMQIGFDAIAQRFDRLETEYQMLDLQALKARVETLERRLDEPAG